MWHNPADPIGRGVGSRWPVQPPNPRSASQRRDLCGKKHPAIPPFAPFSLLKYQAFRPLRSKIAVPNPSSSCSTVFNVNPWEPRQDSSSSKLTRHLCHSNMIVLTRRKKVASLNQYCGINW